MLNNLQSTEKSFVFDKSNAIYLKTMTDNGLATLLDEGSVDVPFENLYELTDFEREIVGLPPIYPFEILVEHDGLPFTPSFSYGVSYRAFAPGGNILPKIAQKGPAVTLKVEGEPVDYLLNLEQFRLIKALDEFNALQSKGRVESYKRFAEIKELSKDSASTLDRTLSDRNVVLPKNVRIDVAYDNGELEIIPSIDDECNAKFIEQFDNGGDVREHYSMGNADQKTIVVLDTPIQEELKNVKRHRKVKDPNVIKAIIDHPEEFFDPEVLDINFLYSDRVIGVGLYTPKVYPFLSPYNSQWIPAFKVEDRTNGTTKIFIKDVADLTELSEAIEQAKKDGASYCIYKGTNIGLNEAQDMLDKSREQLDKRVHVTENGENSIEEKQKGNRVLLIEENMENLGYKVDDDRLVFPDSLTLQPNPNLNSEFILKKHQQEGVAWLQDLCLNAKGGLLADDMGLGKTLQVLYLLDWHSRTNNKADKPYLIVAPVSLLENWEREYKRFFYDGMPIAIVDKMPPYKDASFIKAHSYKHIMVVGYEAMRRAQISLAAIDFAMIVLDEAQKVKAPGTMVTNAAKALKADFRIAMTGTPVENTYMDFWCIMDFAVPGLLGNAREFSKKFQNPLKNASTDIAQLGHDLRAKVGGYFLRRLKTELAHELPQKNELTHEIQMPQVQLERYIEIVNMGNDIRQNEKAPNPLERIQDLRKACDHPYLDIKNTEEISEDELIQSSAKMIATIQIIDDVKSKNEKVIVFTERREMQRMLQRIFYWKYNLEVSVINGETSAKGRGNNISRQATVDRFQEKDGFNIIIMSQLAAGVGLNVTKANHVIHYSRHWNPAKEMQATDRVYRIGQTKDVYVHYPMAVTSEFETFDKVLNQLLQNKTKLASASLYPTDQIEVKPGELDERLFGHSFNSKSEKIVMADVNTMNEYLFEAFAAVYFEKLGYKTMVTQRSGDKGVDVVAENGKDCKAIQCKHTKGKVGVEAVGEVVAGLKYYEAKLGKKYSPVVFTNAYLTNSAQDLAIQNHVEVIDGASIKKIMQTADIHWIDISKKDAERMG